MSMPPGGMRTRHPSPAAAAGAAVAQASGLVRVRRLQLAQIALLTAMALVMLALAIVSARLLLDATARQREANVLLRDLVELRDEGRVIERQYWREVAEGRSGVTAQLVLGLAGLRQRAGELADRQTGDLAAGPVAERSAAGIARGFAQIDRNMDAYLAAADPGRRRVLLTGTLATVEEISFDFDEWVQARVDSANGASRELDRTIRAVAVRVILVMALLTASGLLIWWALGRARSRVLAHVEAVGREQAALRHVAELVAHEGTTDEEAFAALANEVVALTGADAGLVIRVAGDRGTVVGAAFDADHLRDGLGAGTGLEIAREGAVARALQEGRPVRAPAYLMMPGPLGRALLEAGSRVGVATPITVSGRPWGALVVVSGRPGALPPGGEERLEPFARLASLAIAGAQARRRLAERASTDPLTGLPNHGVFHERLHEAAALAIRHGQPLSLAVIDLDHFKEINDTHGHQVGDDVLAEVARRLRGAVRDGELLARVGGEEFAWVMPGTTIDDAVAAAERARAVIAAEPVAGLGGLSASVGVCDLDQAATAGELFRLADRALLLAKAQGRNMTIRFEPGMEDATGDDRLQRAERARTLAALRALARAVDARDPATQRHSERVADLTFRISVAMGWPDGRARALREAALVHDVGKIGVPDAVLSKPGRLTDAEFAQVAAHPALGAAIVTEVLSPEQVAWVRHHHERVDGGGYPDRLAGTAIPEGARILAAADTWDAMTTDRPYRSALSPAEALAECLRVTGSQLDARVVAVMRGLLSAGDPPAASSSGDARAGAVSA